MSTIAIRQRDVGLGKTLAELAKDFKRTFADQEQAIEEAKYAYQTKRIDILHEVLVIKNGDRKATEAWAVKNGPVGRRQVQDLLRGESELYPEVTETKPLTVRRAARARKVRKAIATKGLRPTLYPEASESELEAAEKEMEANQESEASPVFDLAAKRNTALEMLNAGHKVLSSKHHPDKGGSNDMQRFLNDARTWAREIIESHMQISGMGWAVISAIGYCSKYQPTAWREASSKTKKSMQSDVFKNVAKLVTDTALLQDRKIGLVPVNEEAMHRKFVPPDNVADCKQYIRPGKKGYAGIFITNQEDGAMLLAYTEIQKAQAHGKLQTQRIREEGFDRKQLLSNGVKEQVLLTQ